MSSIQYEFFTGEEANLLELHKLDESIRVPWPPTSHILYAINENKDIIGRMGLLQLPHIEGTWIREDYRNGTIAVRMISKVENLLVENDRTAAFAFIQTKDEDIQNYMERLGYIELPLKVYVKALIDDKKQKVA